MHYQVICRPIVLDSYFKFLFEIPDDWEQEEFESGYEAFARFEELKAEAFYNYKEYMISVWCENEGGYGESANQYALHYEVVFINDDGCTTDEMPPESFTYDFHHFLNDIQAEWDSNREHARNEAVEFSNGFENKAYSWGELADKQEHFRQLGTRYMLEDEFHENGIC